MGIFKAVARSLVSGFFYVVMLLLFVSYFGGLFLFGFGSIWQCINFYLQKQNFLD